MGEFRSRNAILFIRKIFFFNSKAMNKTITDKDISSEDKQKGFKTLIGKIWKLIIRDRKQDSTNVYFH